MKKVNLSVLVVKSVRYVVQAISINCLFIVKNVIVYIILVACIKIKMSTFTQSPNQNGNVTNVFNVLNVELIG